MRQRRHGPERRVRTVLPGAEVQQRVIAGQQNEVDLLLAIPREAEQKVEVLDVPLAISLPGVVWGADGDVDACAECLDLTLLAQLLQRLVAALLARRLTPREEGARAAGVGGLLALRLLDVVDHEAVDAPRPQPLHRVLVLPHHVVVGIGELDAVLQTAGPAHRVPGGGVGVGAEVAADLGGEGVGVAREGGEREAHPRLREAEPIPAAWGGVWGGEGEREGGRTDQGAVSKYLSPSSAERVTVSSAWAEGIFRKRSPRLAPPRPRHVV